MGNAAVAEKGMGLLLAVTVLDGAATVAGATAGLAVMGGLSRWRAGLETTKRAQRRQCCHFSFAASPGSTSFAPTRSRHVTARAPACAPAP